MKETFEISRHNVTPAQFASIVRQYIRKHNISGICADDIGLEYWASGNDIEFDYNEITRPNGPAAAEKSVSKPYKMQTYIRQHNGDVYNFIMEFDFWDEKTGYGYCYYINEYTEEDETMEENTQPTEAQNTQPTEATPSLHDVGEAIRNYCQKAGMTEKQLAHVDAAILAVHVKYAAGMLADCVHVSRGNRKIGRLFNFSLLPGFTCGHWASVSCLHGGCYALKENRYPAVLYNRVQNTIMAICFPDILLETLAAMIEAEQPQTIRLHEAGDFVTDRYLGVWLALAQRFPAVTIYTYSKQYERLMTHVDALKAAHNIEIKVSPWPGLPVKAVALMAALYGAGFSLAGLAGDSSMTDITGADTVHPCLNQIDGRSCAECQLCMKRGNVTFKKH